MRNWGPLEISRAIVNLVGLSSNLLGFARSKLVHFVAQLRMMPAFAGLVFLIFVTWPEPMERSLAPFAPTLYIYLLFLRVTASRIF